MVTWRSGHALDTSQGSWTGMASLTLSLHLLDTLGHTGTPLGHNLRILLGALVLLVTV